MKYSIVLIFFFLCYISFSQTRIKDTLVFKVKYKYATHDSTGKLKALSQKKKLRGYWLYFDKDGKEEADGKYDFFGRKHNEWLYMGYEIIYYRHGKKTGRKGFGCKGCEL